MKINWKLRLQNGYTLVGLLSSIVALAYQICGAFGIVPPVSQDEVVKIVGIVFNILVTVGIVTDPTTAGAGDSARALGYDRPKEV
ncbi:MAG: phage holin [Berryella intestinalis]|uniref:phage holin n=1 Tax=Berryella intestinalis TaxID=1531429 RepID=UPI002A74CFD2|nr:phage holin [Berryella intestinalis]MDY3129507.1 phage holin [Berryella intestinalis]